MKTVLEGNFKNPAIEIHPGTSRDSQETVGLDKLNEHRYRRIALVPNYAVIERIPEEGDEGYENKAVAHCRKELITWNFS